MKNVEHAYAIIRIEDPDSGLALSDMIVVKRVMWVEQEARDEAARLNELNADKGCRYLVQTTRIDERSNVERDRGYDDGYNGQGYAPTSTSYIEGYESGKLAAARFVKKDQQTNCVQCKRLRKSSDLRKVAFDGRMVPVCREGCGPEL